MNRRVFISDPDYAVQYAFKTRNGLLYFLQTDKFNYRRGERVRMSLVTVNVSDRPIRLRYRTGQRYDFWVTRGSNEVWRWSDDRSFTQATQTVTLEPGESQSFSAVWDQRANGRTVRPGIYRVNGWNQAARVPISVRILIGQPSQRELTQLPGFVQGRIPAGEIALEDDDEE